MEKMKLEQPPYIPCPECDGKGHDLGHWCNACNGTGSVEGDPGMRKVVNLVTNYMTKICAIGDGPGHLDRFPAAGKPLVNGVVRIDEQDMKDILAAAPKSQRGWIRTRLGYMVVV